MNKMCETEKEMGLVEQKKLVASKWWKTRGEDAGLEIYFGELPGAVGDKGWFYADDWNPQSDRNAWPEILKNMDKTTALNFMLNIDSPFHVKGGYDSCWLILNLPPETLWKALIKTREEKNDT